ncbi:MAG: heme o synthase [Desulfurococcales archaeon]|nr:heme o synthase [Desulfurococcales archaeon]
MNIRATIKAVVEMTKPLQTFLLMITMVGGYLAAGGTDLVTLLLLLIVGYTSIGGTTVLNMYLERDIDAVMNRTKKRPLPSRRISESATVLSALILLSASIAFAELINSYVVLTVLAGLYFDVLIYTNLVKRRTPYNIVLGGIAGAMPALGGWAAAVGAITLGGLLLSLAVMLWIPLHIWILAYYLKDEYAKAQIPMFPVVASPFRTATYIKAALYILVLNIAVFTVTQGYGIIAFIATSILVYKALKLLNLFKAKPNKSTAFKLYKFASPIMGTLFILLPIDYWLRIYESIIFHLI